MDNVQYTKIMGNIDKLESFVDDTEEFLNKFYDGANRLLAEVEEVTTQFLAGVREGIEKERAKATAAAEKDVWGQATDSPSEPRPSTSEQQIIDAVSRITRAYRATRKGAGMNPEDIADKVKSTVDEILRNRNRPRGTDL